MTGGLLAYPILAGDGALHAIESIGRLPEPALFALVLGTWAVSNACYALLSEGYRGHLAVVGCFAAVYLLFWVRVLPGGGLEGVVHAAYVQLLGSAGQLPDPTVATNFGYFEFPGLAILGAATSLVAGLPPLPSMEVLTAAWVVCVVLVLWIVAVTVSNSVVIGSLATWLAVEGNLAITRMTVFHPDSLGFALFAVGLLVLHVVIRQRQRIGSSLCLIAVASALAVTQVVPAVLFAVVAGVAFTIRQPRRLPSAGLLLLVLPVAWLGFYAAGFLGAVTKTLVFAVVEQLQRGFTFSYAQTVVEGQLGGDTPAWASMLKIGWAAVVLGGGIAAALSFLRQPKTARGLLSWQLMALAVVTGGAALASHGGDQFYRYLFFSIPFGAALIGARLSMTRAKRLAAPGLVLLAVLAAPTFLATYNTVASRALRPSEMSMGSRLAGGFPAIATEVYTDPVTAAWLPLYLPRGRFVAPAGPITFITSPNDVWPAWDKAKDAFLTSDGPAIFVYNSRVPIYYAAMLAVSETDQRWTLLVRAVQRDATVAWDDGASFLAVHNY